jgi:hypothetical protein
LKNRPGKFDHVHFDPSRRKIVRKRCDQFLRLAAIKRAMKKVHPNDAKGFLLVDVGCVKQTDVDDDLARLRARLGLKSHPKPAVRFAAVFETTGSNCVGKNEECFFGSEFLVEALDQKIILVIEHRLKTDATDVALRRSVNGVAECHVVRGHSLRDRARRATYAKKSPGYFLSGADLGKSPILGGVEIDLEGLFVGADLHLWIHIISLTAIDRARKRRSFQEATAWAAVDLNFDGFPAVIP